MNDSECVLWLNFLTLYWFNKDKPLPLHYCTHRFAESASLGCTDYWWEFHYPVSVFVFVCVHACVCTCWCICLQVYENRHVNCVWELNWITGWVHFKPWNHNRGSSRWVIQCSRCFQTAPDTVKSVWPCLTWYKTSAACPIFSVCSVFPQSYILFHKAPHNESS